MKKFLKITFFTFLAIIVLLYLAFLFVIPRVIHIDDYKQLIQDSLKEQAKLSINFENPKVVTTPLLGAGVKLDNLVIQLPDNSELFSAENITTRVSLPHLLWLTVKISACEVNNPKINLEILNDKQFKLVSLIEDLLNEGKEQKLEDAAGEELSKCWFNPEWIKIKVPNVVLNNYSVLVNDLKTKHYLLLKGEKLNIGYFNGKTLKVKTYAELFSDEQKNITANIDINTFLPKPQPKLDSEDDPAERVDIPFVNPVTMYRNYDLKANADAKLKIREHSGEINSYGYFNIDNVTMKISNLVLPESYFRAKTFGTNANLDFNVFVKENQNIKLDGKINYGKAPKTDLFIKTADIKFNDMIILAKAFLDSLHIKNELNTIHATGGINADCYLKTNFKKLKSNGFVIVKDGGISVDGIGQVIKQANINLILDDNVLDIKDSQLYVKDSKVNIDGKIDEKSYADIKVQTEKISLPVLFKAFAPKEIRNAYIFSSGDASIDLKLTGKLKKALMTLRASVEDFNISDRKRTFVVSDKEFKTEFFVDTKNIKGLVKNSNLKLFIPQTKSSIDIPECEVQVADNNIAISENKINFNDSTSFTYSGNIEDYTKLKSLNFSLHGDLYTDDIVKLLGKELKPFIHNKGLLPVKLTFDGNSKKQTMFLQVLSDKENYITPVDFDELKDKNISLQSVIDFKGNRTKIKKTGFYTRNISVDDKGNEVITLDEIFGIDGTIAGNTINLIKLTMPKELTGNIYVFPKSKFKLSGRAFIFGELAAPRMRGGFEIQNLSIPELLIDLRRGLLKFRGNEADFNLSDLILNGSDLQLNGTFSLVPSAIFNILNLDVNSRYFNVDRVMKVVDKSMSYVPASAPAAGNSQPADIPVAIRHGNINFSRIISGAIDIKNTVSRMSLSKNVLYLNNLRTNIFDGNVRGNIFVDLVTSFINVDVSGQNVDVDKAMVQAAAMKNTLSGTADFKAKLSLQGATYEEQMKSLTGNVEFNVTDGQFGPFGKIENLILAENIRESKFFQTALGGILDGLLTIDTTHFSELTGSLSFEDGICHIEPITSLGNILSLHVFGDFDLLRNYADMKVRARMASLISNLLGPLGAINPANILNSAASLNVVTAKAFSIFCEMVPEDELAALPSFSNKYVDNSATKFQIVVRGDVAKPLRLVKSFKWLASKTEYDNAIEYVNSLPDPIEGSTATTIEEAIAEKEALDREQAKFTYKLRHIFDKKE